MEYLVSPISKKPLQIEKGKLTARGENKEFNIVEGVPLLQPLGCIADYTTEWHEILFGKNAKKINDMLFEKYGKTEEYFKGLEKYVKAELGKEGAKNAFYEYANFPENKRLEWWYKDKEEKLDDIFSSLTKKAIESGRKYATKKYAQKKNEQYKNMVNKWAVHIPKYTELILKVNSKVILELGTGAGLGTWGILKNKLKRNFISIDIDYACVKTAEGFSKLFEIENKVDSIVANFWYLPFKSNSIDVICSHYGLDESREVPRILEEVSRILNRKGKFISVSRSDPTLRMKDILEKIGFSKEEMKEMIKISRLYPGHEVLSSWANEADLLLKDLIKISPSSSHERLIYVFEKR